MNGHDEVENQKIEEEMEEEEIEEEWYEMFKHLLVTIQAIICLLNEFITSMSQNRIQYPLSRRRITSHGYNYIHTILNEDPVEFRQLYRCILVYFSNYAALLEKKHSYRIQGLFALKKCLQPFY